MKHYPLLITMVLLLSGVAFAQDTQHVIPLRRTIVDALQENTPGEGTIIIDQPPAIRAMIGGRRDGSNLETTADGQTFLKHQGYRVQIFSGNNQRTAKDEAFRKEKQIKERFPSLDAYVTYTAPFWRLRVGNYDSHEEAFYAQRQLTEAFPSFAKEIYIVREEVKVPIYY
jgi:hypothetical protein